jgi:hypothetical protein
MSFNPIEPLKPINFSSEPGKPGVPQLVKSKSDTVPEAEFDWNSSGLTNPLDGKLQNLFHFILLSYFLVHLRLFDNLLSLFGAF